MVVDEGIARPLLVGRPAIIAERIAEFGLRLQAGVDCELVDALAPDAAGAQACATRLGAMLLQEGRADAMLCGTAGRFHDHLGPVREVIGLKPGNPTFAVMQMLILPGRQLFICDTHVNPDPTAREIADIALMAAEEVRRFGITPSVALLSHSSFGSSDEPAALKMREALALVKARDPSLAVDGEMRGDAALSKSVLDHECPASALSEEANVLVMPNVDAANISYNLLRIAAGGGITVGGILLGAARAVHILTPSSTVRRIVNMTALASLEAGAPRGAD